MSRNIIKTSGGVAAKTMFNLVEDRYSIVEYDTLFFTPFKNSPDTFFRATQVVAAPFALTAYSAPYILKAGFELLKAIGNILTLNFSNAVRNVGKALGNTIISTGILISALLSPLINFVDFLGSIMTSLEEASQVSDKQFSLSCSR
ncbi:MAG: hypothetical protein QM652_07985 [Legionella sp.]|uniref:hypothetical protein n=1 Tax=Legionella sp. TaxID=459 RepID=UPI0039E62902